MRNNNNKIVLIKNHLQQYCLADTSPELSPLMQRVLNTLPEAEEISLGRGKPFNTEYSHLLLDICND